MYQTIDVYKKQKIFYLSHPLQKCSVACFGIFSVTSTSDRKHATHMFAGLGSMPMPQIQHNLQIQLHNSYF